MKSISVGEEKAETSLFLADLCTRLEDACFAPCTPWSPGQKRFFRFASHPEGLNSAPAERLSSYP